MENIPFLQAEFRLKEFSVALVNDESQYEGIELFSKEFTIDFKKFEENKKENVNKFVLVARNEDFGVN